MNPSFIIAHKRDGGEISEADIRAFVNGYVCGDVADYQMSALAMAICCRGMTIDETAALTDAMLQSGERFTWDADGPACVDKHSTGGIGDKVSLPLAGMLAACGLRVPMISGRGLGATGGTLDKLEAIAGFRTNLDLGEVVEVVNRVGCVITGATPGLVPADRKLYALRDVTGTVPSIPLITASIMSKKLAEGLKALVLDVKWGSGAFMKTLDDARKLAQSLVATGKRMGVATTALVTDMNQPLGTFAGNALEVDESLAMLRGEDVADALREITLALGAELLISTGLAGEEESARNAIATTIENGSAERKFTEMVAAQGGDLKALRPIAPRTTLACQRSGYVASIDTEALGRVIIQLGGGRRKLGDTLDFSVGLGRRCRIGDRVEVGQPLIDVFAQPSDVAHIEPLLRQAIQLGDAPVDPPQLIVERIE